MEKSQLHGLVSRQTQVLRSVGWGGVDWHFWRKKLLHFLQGFSQSFRLQASIERTRVPTVSFLFICASVTHSNGCKYNAKCIQMRAQDIEEPHFYHRSSNLAMCALSSQEVRIWIFHNVVGPPMPLPGHLGGPGEGLVAAPRPPPYSGWLATPTGHHCHGVAMVVAVLVPVSCFVASLAIYIYIP